MTDIVDRLRAVAALADFEADAVVIRSGADEIVSLREAIRRLAGQDATLSVCDGIVTVTMDATLTDAEREAIEFFVGFHNEGYGLIEIHADTLRKMLERTK
ncbi:hypothetical protein [Sphingorhabdus sp.]|uniref:hypothetical protein n=1 Tax=Sphingorhabdus sp. TaxID=1902408 RepID=UPI003340C5B1